MKSKGMGWVLVLLITVTPAMAREFTDEQGRKIEAEIDSVRPPNVVLKRGGKNFLFPLAKLSAADQAFVEQWVIDNPDIKLEYRYAKKKTDSSGSSESRKEKWAYEVTVENRALTNIDKLKVHYTIFKQVHDRYAKGAKKRLSGKESGSKEIDGIESQRTFVFATKSIGTKKINKVSTNGTLTTYERWSESLIGIKLKVTRGDQVISEHSYGIVD